MIKRSYLRWLAASAAIALLPIFARWLYLKIHNRNPGLEALLGGGELFLISAILSADLVGHMIGRGFWDKDKEGIAVMVSSLVLLVVLPLAILCYTLLCPQLVSHDDGPSGGSLNMNFVVALSIMFFAATIVGNSVVRTQIEL